MGVTGDMDPNLDLAKILATLASLPKPETPYQEQHPQEQNAIQHYPGFHDPTQTYSNVQVTGSHWPADPRLAGRVAPQHHQSAPKPQERPLTPSIDPSTITEWKQGLRFVSKLAVHNPDVVPAVRKAWHRTKQREAL